MPKVKFGKEEIVTAALDIVRNQGEEALNARALAAKLNCSTQPIFSNFENMEELRMAVVEKGMEIYHRYLHQEMTSGVYPPYKASGMGYIRLAREEGYLFRLLFMRNRSEESGIQQDTSMVIIYEMLQKMFGCSQEQAEWFHLEMWVFVHGIATMIATGYLDWDEKTVSTAITDMYHGLRMRLMKGAEE